MTDPCNLFVSTGPVVSGDHKAAYSVEGQVVVVTGGGSGIGRATAIEFIKAGAYVVVADYKLSAAQETVRECETIARPSSIVPTLPVAIAVNADVTSPTSVQALVAETVRVYGNRVHALVNNAGIQVRFVELTYFTTVSALSS
jgi:NAD(P)-dependent dehydrogenase (short-subunit alcohol dehydrogenase family)